MRNPLDELMEILMISDEEERYERLEALEGKLANKEGDKWRFESVNFIHPISRQEASYTVGKDGVDCICYSREGSDLVIVFDNDRKLIFPHVEHLYFEEMKIASSVGAHRRRKAGMSEAL